MSINIILPVVTGMLTLSLLVLAFVLIGSLLHSGLKGGGHNSGPTYGFGFGAHHPGGIMLSDKERKGLKKKNIIHEIIRSY